MKVTLHSTDAPLAYTGVNAAGHEQHFSGKADACRPMETLLMCIAACSAIDVETLLEKMRVPAAGVTVTVEGERADAVPAVFTKVHLHYAVRGDVPLEKAEKAAGMSMAKYCSVSAMLKGSVAMTHSVAVEGEVRA